jgi:predicted acyltransferase
MSNDDPVQPPSGIKIELDRSPKPAPPPLEPDKKAMTVATASASVAPAPPVLVKPAAVRLISLDAFRGLTILGMLLVNNIALDIATPVQFTHAPWNQGLHFADLVFPWFLLIVGIAIPFSAAKAHNGEIPAWQYDLRILSRTVILVFLGCLLDSSEIKRPIFDLNVLQLIGLAYFVGAFLYEVPVIGRGFIAAVFLIGYWAVLRFVAVPGLSPGVLSENANLITYLNSHYLTAWHLAGITSVVPTAGLVLLGTLAGDMLRNDSHPGPKKSGLLLAWGAGLAILGLLWSLLIPFNKAIWTSSYIVFSAGSGLIVLGICHYLMDTVGLRFLGTPLAVFGANAIFAYVTPILAKYFILREWTIAGPGGHPMPMGAAFLAMCDTRFGTYLGGWVYTAGYVLFWWLVLLIMYRKRIFLRI